MKKFLIMIGMMVLLFSTGNAREIVGPRLQFVQSAYHHGLSAFYNLPNLEKLPVTVISKNELNSKMISRLRTVGFEAKIYRDKPLGSAHVLTGFIDMRQVDFNQLKANPDILEIETTWRPHHAYPLPVSRPQIEAEQVWNMSTPAVTGKNILIADLDTGVNHFHPMFFFADGDTFQWTDVNQNGQFDPGGDGVDLDSSGTISATEKLRYIQASTAGALTNPSGYNPSLDWVYADVNQNQQRDYGPQAGFTESDPGYGEPLFITLDANSNDELDPGELLVMLKTSKVRKVYQSDGVIRERGVDMIQNEGDYYGHGTPVSGILLGGVPGVHRFAGIAPDAELLMGVNVYIPDPPFIETMEFLAPWAAAEGANVILYEDGEWIWQYMDGSSALETMMDDFTNQGIVQVVPAGNLAGGGMHTSGNIPASDSLTVPMSMISPNGQQKIWGTFLWLGDSSGISYKLEIQPGQWITLSGDSSFTTIGNFQVYSNQSRSYRSTNRMDFIIASTSGSLSGTFNFRLKNQVSSALSFHAYEVDDRSSWSGLTRWTQANDDGTITWPSTADLAFSVGAYNPRNSQQSLNGFSGQGARVDGMRLVDITAPGSTVYSTSNSNYAGFTAFGGTSSAGPHVAGACALLLQLSGGANISLIKDVIGQGANTDNIPGTLPNNIWGYGRLRVKAAADILVMSVSNNRPSVPQSVALSAFPNPFNPATQIQFTTNQRGAWELIIYNILGERIERKAFFLGSNQNVSYRWNAESQPAGIYLVALKGPSGIARVKKLVLVK